MMATPPSFSRTSKRAYHCSGPATFMKSMILAKKQKSQGKTDVSSFPLDKKVVIE
jgi:hypothetical protein